jgi:ubiquinone/menaquinone biosynthesis C-methylase UbiE
MGIKLDIACGERKAEGFVGIDLSALAGVDIVHDLERFPWPVEADSVEEARVSHYIEHTRDLIAFMNELHRVLQRGAKCVIVAPYYNSIQAWQDPTHTRAISEATFLYFNAEQRQRMGVWHYPITCDFDFTVAFGFHPEWINRPAAEREFARRHYTNVVGEIQATLTKR